MKRVKQIPGVTSVWRVTGHYDLFFEIMVDSLEKLKDVLFGEDLEGIPAILRTETFVVLWSDTKFLKLS
jgi:DNA-binding Lrp family transcriptional regulator